MLSWSAHAKLSLTKSSKKASKALWNYSETQSRVQAQATPKSTKTTHSKPRIDRWNPSKLPPPRPWCPRGRNWIWQRDWSQRACSRTKWRGNYGGKFPLKPQRTKVAVAKKDWLRNERKLDDVSLFKMCIYWSYTAVMSVSLSLFLKLWASFLRPSLSVSSPKIEA